MSGLSQHGYNRMNGDRRKRYVALYKSSKYYGMSKQPVGEYYKRYIRPKKKESGEG